MAQQKFGEESETDDENPNQEDTDIIPPGSPERTPVEDPGRDEPKVRDPLLPDQKNQRLKNH